MQTTTDENLRDAMHHAAGTLQSEGRPVTIDAIHHRMLTHGWAVSRAGVLNLIRTGTLDTPPEPV